MQEDTVIAQRLICDYVTVCGGVLKVPLSKEMLASAASARSRYRMHLEQEKRKKMSDVQGQKRKAAEEEMEELKKSKATLIAVTNSLSQDADQPAKKAEEKAGTLMAQLITKSNTLRKRHREKMVMEKKLHKVHVEWQRIKYAMSINAAKTRAMEVALEEARRQADKERSLRLIAEAKDDKLEQTMNMMMKVMLQNTDMQASAMALLDGRTLATDASSG
ncbi:hypothetical protein AAFF_G00355550 [Aldrovandia affinis]|uniref:Uncharacterized protein n=1 Tax=Aldrovandia affinis TaxID=143900 RepID=A0AAD7R5I3_9TELE|nr:hypothetical protein AAFF_G00355550 [Aldrovandia affinis]